jgi:hypothetical protein
VSEFRLRGSKQAALAGLLVVAWLAGPLRASELSWEGAPNCADREPLLFELERALGKPLPEAGELTFHVSVESSGARVRARVRVDDAETGGAGDERVLEAASCPELTDTLAVALSLAIGRSESAAAPEPSLAASAAPPEMPEMPEGAVAADVDTSAAENAANEAGSGPRPSAYALVVADVGSLPHPALGAGLGVELSWPRLRVQLGAAMFLPQRAEWARGSDVGADLGLTVGIARVCTPALSSPSRSFSIPVCGGVELGRMDGVGYGVLAARSREILWIAPRAEVGVAWAPPDTPLRLETSLGASLPLNRDEFIFDGMGTIHRPSRVAGRLGASLNLLFE